MTFLSTDSSSYFTWYSTPSPLNQQFSSQLFSIGSKPLQPNPKNNYFNFSSPPTSSSSSLIGRVSGNTLSYPLRKELPPLLPFASSRSTTPSPSLSISSSSSTPSALSSPSSSALPSPSFSSSTLSITTSSNDKKRSASTAHLNELVKTSTQDNSTNSTKVLAMSTSSSLIEAPSLGGIELRPKKPEGRQIINGYIANHDFVGALAEASILTPSQIKKAMQKNKEGWNPLHLAAYYQIPSERQAPGKEASSTLIEFFISHGIDANELNGNGVAALHLASHYGNEHILNVLVDLAEINKLDAKGLTPLDHAYNSPSTQAQETIEFLRKAGGKIAQELQF